MTDSKLQRWFGRERSEVAQASCMMVSGLLIAVEGATSSTWILEWLGGVFAVLGLAAINLSYFAAFDRSEGREPVLEE